MSALARLNLLLVASLVAHTLDHALNQPARDLPASGTFVGVAGFAIVAASALLALRRSDLAPAASVGAGLATALGIVAVHLLPAWSDLVSDPYADFDPNALSWALAIAPLAVGLWLVVIAGRQLRRPAAA